MAILSSLQDIAKMKNEIKKIVQTFSKNESVNKKDFFARRKSVNFSF